MELFYYMVFGALGAVVAAVELSKANKDRITTSQAFTSFKNNYLLVYSLMMGTFSITFLYFTSFRLFIIVLPQIYKFSQINCHASLFAYVSV